MRVAFLSLLLVLATTLPGQSSPPGRIVEKNPVLQPLPPREAMKHIRLPPGFRLELVASEPQIREPVAIAWDGNGRMFVAEMLSLIHI